jgi:hypothetical protein
MTYWVHSAPDDVALGEGQRPCARGEHCAARTTAVEDGERVVVPAATYRVFCDPDEGRIKACLEEIPHRYRQLGERIGDKGVAAGPRVSGGGQTGSPVINLGIEAFQRQITEVIFSWDERVRDPAKLSDLAGVTVAAALDSACGVLAAHIGALLSLEQADTYRSMDIARHETLPEDANGWVHPAAGWIQYNTALGGVNAGIEILNLHHRALNRLGLTPQHQDLISRCWVCGERELRRHDGTAGLADHVECLKCREQYLGPRIRSLMVEEEAAQLRKHDRAHRQQGRTVLHRSAEGSGGRP